ncbi:MAG: phosphate ABC transporter permease PstA [Bacteroidales bacterium]
MYFRILQIEKGGKRTRIIKDKLFFIGVCVFSFFTTIPLLLILWELLKKGYKQLNWHFFVESSPSSLDAMLALQSGEPIPGGIANGIIGSFCMVILATVISVPIGIFTGIYLSEHPKSKFSGLIRAVAELIQGTPSIVVGLIIYAWVVKPLGGYSGFAGGVALSILMLPLIIRSTEETLRMLPVSLKEAGLALGSSYTNVILKVLLPSAFGGLFTGILLSVSRVLGETAPLMLTALGAMAIEINIMRPMSAIPLQIWEFYNDPNLSNLIWTASLFLLLFIFFLNLTAKQIAKKWKI